MPTSNDGAENGKQEIEAQNLEIETRNDEVRSYSAAVLLGLLAVGGVVVAVLVAILAGFLLGHYTHVRTKTVAERTVTERITTPSPPSPVKTVTVTATTTTPAATTAPAATTTPTATTAPAATTTPTATTAPAPTTTPAATSAPASAIPIAASPSGGLMFNTKKLSAPAGKDTFVFTNKSPLPHNFTIMKGSKVIGATPTFAKGVKDLVVTLPAGTYVFECTVPGHAAAGMKGTLTVT